MNDLFTTFRLINLVCLYVIAAMAILVLAGIVGVDAPVIVMVSGAATAGILYYRLFKFLRRVRAEQKE